MDLIEKAIAALPPPAGREWDRWRQYEDAKQQLSKLVTTCAEYERMCKDIARWYEISYSLDSDDLHDGAEIKLPREAQKQ